MPRLDRSRHGPELDTALPALVLWVSPFPLQHGCLGVFRSLGRAGVTVYAVVANREAPVARSRHVVGTIISSPDWRDTPAQFVDRLLDIGRQLGRRSLIVCTSDEMAVIVAEHRHVLEEFFVLPTVASGLPAELADKRTLHDLCQRHGVATPRSVFIDSMDQLQGIADDLNPPVVVKSTALRGQVQSVENTTVVPTRSDLLDLARTWTEPFRTLIQEYIPDEASEDWFAHGYCDAEATARVVFTGRKVRCWPARGGSTAAGFTAANAELAELTATFCAHVGYRGIFDLDWRRDLRTGQYYLLDFNPRVGAQFRMFEDDAGIDVVRAMHLDLSGRDIPSGNMIEGERFIVEPWDLASLIANRRRPIPWAGGVGRPRAAWLAGDDLRPVLSTVMHQVGLSIKARLPGVPNRRNALSRCPDEAGAPDHDQADR
ncbi:ATP-grasp domain-containing protein [Mycolicibacterium sp.]|uniref:carboxylate--amine ligase n=1 Tax=Mycolicibacterium sp. TaxID=2320850 RepID=UPI001A253704|nr:ATP-grasp domain-containing protein [Mycolicibacterium sp.]MBJ7339221.1 ATP-grasp domain-containing protein [Mycolicibacterium sp.]